MSSSSSSSTTPLSDRRRGLLLVQFVGAAVVWGSSFFFVRVALDAMSWGHVALGRLVLGAVTLALILVLRRSWRRPRGSQWGHVLVIGVVGSYIPYTLFAWAGQQVPSALISVLNATTPLMTILMVAFAFRVEKPRTRQLAGVGVGVAGVMLLMQPWAVATGSLIGQLACLGATACYGFTYAYLRRFVAPLGFGAIEVAFLQIGTAAVVAAVTAPLTVRGEVAWSLAPTASLVALGILGTALAYVWNLNVMAGLGSTAASTITYLAPVIGVALGTLVLGEAFGILELLGAVVVIVGITLVLRRGQPTREPRSPRTNTTPASEEADLR